MFHLSTYIEVEIYMDTHMGIHLTRQNELHGLPPFTRKTECFLTWETSWHLQNFHSPGIIRELFNVTYSLNLCEMLAIFNEMRSLYIKSTSHCHKDLILLLEQLMYLY